MVNHFLSKISKFCVVWTIRFCSNQIRKLKIKKKIIRMCSKYLSNNVQREFRVPMSASAMVTWNIRSENQVLQKICRLKRNSVLPLLMLALKVWSLSIHSLKIFVPHAGGIWTTSYMSYGPRILSFLTREKMIKRWPALFWKTFL